MREAIPVVVDGGRKGTQCKPFLVVQKDEERFAACNALADEIGPLNEPEKAAEFLREVIGDEVNEVFGVMTLDLHCRLKGLTETGRGEPSSVMAPIQATLRAAINSGGEYALIFHVHPSGIEAKPSKADKDTTKAFAKAFDAIDMQLIDHIIIAGDSRAPSYYSFLEDNAL
jgi:DNA repair protein RadC